SNRENKHSRDSPNELRTGTSFCVFPALWQAKQRSRAGDRPRGPSLAASASRQSDRITIRLVALHLSAFYAVDGCSTGTEVPSMWALLRLPRFGGANHADGHDNRPRHRKVGFSNPRN